MKVLIALALLSSVACVGSGEGEVKGALWVKGCRDEKDLSETWDMRADFFGGEPIEDVDRVSPENRLEIRIQRNGSHVEESDTLLISIPDVRKAAAEWLRRGGPGAPLDVSPDGLVRATLHLFATCPLTTGSRSSSNEAMVADTPSQIFFQRFGNASGSPDGLAHDFIIDFGDEIETLPGDRGFYFDLIDYRSKTIGDPPQASGWVRGSFKFEVRRGAAGQSFP